MTSAPGESIKWSRRRHGGGDRVRWRQPGMVMVRRPGFGGGSAAVGFDGGSLVAARLPGRAVHGCRVAA